MVKKKLSIHRPNKKIFNADNFGYYLAGLIDGNGYISTLNQIVISFNLADRRSAIILRSRIGYGVVRPVKNKHTCNLIISNKKGLFKVALLLKDKLRHPTKIFQYNNRLTKFLGIEKTLTDSTINWDTPWFSGFFDSHGYFKIHISQQKNRISPEIRLLMQIDQKQKILLEQVKRKFGGYLGYKESQDTFCYSSISFKNFHTILKFFDKFSLQSDRSYLRYVILRKSYLLVQENKHLQELGLQKMKNYHKKLKDMI